MLTVVFVSFFFHQGDAQCRAMDARFYYVVREQRARMNFNVVLGMSDMLLKL